MPKIFIPLASMHDTELVSTVTDAFEKASNPNNIFIGVSLIDSDEEIKNIFLEKTKKYESNIRFKFKKVTKKSAESILGVGIGRSKAWELYNEEDYALQCDSHAIFGKDWDSRLISLHKKAIEHVKNNKVIITGYGGAYTFNKDGERYFVNNHPKFPQYQGHTQYPVFSNRRYYGVIPGWDLASTSMLSKMIKPGEFAPAIKFNANFSFGDKIFIKNNGLKKDFAFFEEEMIQTCELVSNGFTFVYPTTKDPLVGHLYTDFYVENLGYRKALSDYFEDIQYKFSEKAVKNYKEYFENPLNKDKIKKYTSYSKWNPFFGSIYSHEYIPDYYINSEVKYGK
jgi:hypothetical protein